MNFENQTINTQMFFNDFVVQLCKFWIYAFIGILLLSVLVLLFRLRPSVALQGHKLIMFVLEAVCHLFKIFAGGYLFVRVFFFDLSAKQIFFTMLNKIPMEEMPISVVFVGIFAFYEICAGFLGIIKLLLELISSNSANH